jgi:hypothetical protein
VDSFISTIGVDFVSRTICGRHSVSGGSMRWRLGTPRHGEGPGASPSIQVPVLPMQASFSSKGAALLRGFAAVAARCKAMAMLFDSFVCRGSSP